MDSIIFSCSIIWNISQMVTDISHSMLRRVVSFCSILKNITSINRNYYLNFNIACYYECANVQIVKFCYIYFLICFANMNVGVIILFKK